MTATKTDTLAHETTMSPEIWYTLAKLHQRVYNQLAQWYTPIMADELRSPIRRNVKCIDAMPDYYFKANRARVMRPARKVA